MKVEDTVAVITGGASGLGEATGRRLLAEGARGVICLDMDEKRGAGLSEELGDRFRCFRCDIGDEADVDRAVAAGAEAFGAVHIVVNAAAIGGPAKLIGGKGPIPMEKFDRVVKVNLYGAVHVMRAAVPVMMRNTPNADGERGVIVNVASGAAYEGQTGQLAYAASKAGIVGMTLPLMRELSVHGVRVMTIAPGAFDTPMYAQAPAEVKEDLVRQSMFPKRMGHPDEFAMLVEEIVRNPMHNGRAIRLDAGMILAAG